MRITADVILRAQVSINPLRERELNLRGLKAPAIENLGVTKDGFDCIDLSDNEIKKLENFPRLRRLRMLLLHNNHIAKFQDHLVDSIANVEYLILTGNRVAQLAELDRLACLSKLDTLALGGNPVTKRKYYREYVIHTLPQLKVLDFKKIKPHDREAAKVLFRSLAGQKIALEAHHETNGATDASATHGIETVSIAPPPPPPAVPAVPAVAVAPAPAPAPTVVVVAPPPAAVAVPSAVTSPAKSPVKSRQPAPAAALAPARVAPASPMQVEPVAAADATTPPRTPSNVAADDVAMEDADERKAAAVPFTPSKPIAQMTVAALREELKSRGLAIKGLKAELVQRLKDATGA